MSKEKNQIIGIDYEDLKNLIQIVVRDQIETCLTECRFGTEYKEEVWTRKMVADFFNVTPDKITDSVNRNEIPCRKVGREFFFLKSQIIKMFKKGKQ